MDSVLSVLAMVGELLALGWLIGSSNGRGIRPAEERPPARLRAQSGPSEETLNGRQEQRAMGDRAMDNPAQSGERLREELSDVLELIRRAGGGVVFEDFPGAIDEMDGDSAGQSRAARGAAAPVLVEEANRLAETLDRLRRGDCGASEEVGDLVAAASPGGPRDGPVVHRRSLATSVVDQGPLGGSEAAD